MKNKLLDYFLQGKNLLNMTKKLFYCMILKFFNYIMTIFSLSNPAAGNATSEYF